MAEAGQRQLRTAIRLHMEGKDAISVHALAASANELFERLCKANGKQGFRETMLTYLRPDAHKTVLTALNKAKNYFKHGDKADFEFNSETNVYELGAACLNAGAFGSEDPIARFFLGWLSILEPDLVSEPFRSQMQQTLPSGFWACPPEVQRAYGLELLDMTCAQFGIDA